MPRVLIWLIAIPLLLIVLAAILIPILLDEEKLVAMASETLHKETGATLTVDGEASLSLFPEVALSLGDVGLSMPGDAGSSISLKSLALGVELRPLLSQEVKISNLAVEGLVAVLQSPPPEPQVDTSGMSDAELDAFYAKRRAAVEAAGESAGAEAALAVPLALNVAKLSVLDSRIEQVPADGGQPSVIEIRSLEARDLNLDNRPIPLELEVAVPGEGDQPPLVLVLDGEMRVDQAGQLLNIDRLAARVTGAMQEAIEAKLDGQVMLSDQIADVNLTVDLGETRGQGTLRYASFESPQIDARLKLNLLDPALLVLAGPEAAEKAADSAPAETGDGADSGDQALPLDAIRSIDTRARLDVERAVFGDHAVTDVLIKLRAVEGVVKVNTFTGDLHGGKIDLKATFNAKHNTARLQTQGGLNGMDLPTALAAAGSEPVLEGIANINWKLKAEGSTSNQLIEAMQGPIEVEAANAVLKGTSVEGMLCRAVALVNQESLSAQFPEDSTFEQLSATLKLKDGKAQLTPLTITLPAVNLSGEGRLQLLEQDFRAKFAAELSPELSEMDPACRVNERLTDIDWPVECKGSITGDPADWCSVDAEEIIADLAKNEAGRKLKKEAGKLFDKILDR